MSFIQTGEKEPIVVMALNSSGNPLVGKTDIKIRIRRITDGFYLDWSDNIFKLASLVTELKSPLVEISPTYSPGEYFLNRTGHSGGFDTSTVVNANTNDIYFIIAEQSPGTDVKNFPQVGEVRVGYFINDISVDRYPIIF